MNAQTIGSYLDSLLFLVLGAAFLALPHKFFRSNGHDEERRKKIKVLKICGAVMIICSVGKIVLKWI